jgi:carbohydrate kinase (thermoresistant glucokinase family)
MRRGEPLTDHDRDPWLDTLREVIERRVREGRPAVLACSALKASYRNRIGIDQQRVVSVFLNGPKDLIATRIANREHAFMPASLLDSQFDSLEPPSGGVRVPIDTSPEGVVEHILAALERAAEPPA